jgi:guanylate cyclase, other
MHVYREAKKYLYRVEQLSKHKTCSEIEGLMKRARSLLVVVSTPPTTKYDLFTAKVREYNALPPFEFVSPTFPPNKRFVKYISIYAAYLYDSVKLYAKALHQLLTKEKRPLTDDVIREVASNGTAIIEAIIQNRTYKSESINMSSHVTR